MGILKKQVTEIFKEEKGRKKILLDFKLSPSLFIGHT